MPVVDQTRSASARQPVRRLVELLGPYRGRFALGVVALLCASGIALAYPMALKRAVDGAIAYGSAFELDRLLLLVCGLVLVNAGLTWTRTYALGWVGERIVADLRSRLYRHMIRLSPEWFHDRQSGEVVGRLLNDVAAIRGVLEFRLAQGLQNAVQMIGGLALMFVLDARLASMVVLVAPPLGLAGLAFGRAVRRVAAAVQDRLAKASGHAQESLSALQTVQSFDRADYESARYQQKIEAGFEHGLSLIRWTASFESAAAILAYAVAIALVWVGAHAMIGGSMSAGDLAAFCLYTLMIARALDSLTALWSAVQRAVGASERVFSILDAESMVSDPPAPRILPSGPLSVQFDNVYFSYPSRPERQVLSGVDFSIAPGEVVALVGVSGAGKSTITALLQRFYDVNNGRVLVGNIDVRVLELARLRRAIAIMPQDPVLFSDTIWNNIAYGDLNASPEKIEQAAVAANVHEIVNRLPDGYETLVGERGVRLSGGQRQRIAIARALLSGAKILLFDEATSNLDAEGELLVRQALGRAVEGRTAMIIAHRLSTVRDADRVLVLSGGRIVEQGTHAELMEADGVYRRQAEVQLSGAANR